MEQQLSPALMEHFSGVEDPRLDRQKQHKLIDIPVIAICAVLCGANDWVAVETFGKAKQGSCTLSVRINRMGLSVADKVS